MNINASQSLNHQKIRLGIWGLNNSGKTVYMTMLYHYLSIKKYPQWRVVVNDPKTQKFVEDNLSSILNDGKFPENTRVIQAEENDVYDLYSYKLVNDTTKEIVELTFFDLPGEYYLELENEGAFKDKKLINYLTECDGILFLISSLKEDSQEDREGYYDRVLGNLFRSMQTELKTINKLQQYISFGITKADHPDNFQEFLRQKPEDSLLRLLGNNISLDWLDTFFHAKIKIDRKKKKLEDYPSEYNRCQIFYISCFGVDKNNKGELVSPVYREDTEKSDSDPFMEKPPSSEADQDDRYRDDNGTFKDPQEASLYYINKQARFKPINMISPIQWMVEGIKKCPPQIVTPFEDDSN